MKTQETSINGRLSGKPLLGCLLALAFAAPAQAAVVYQFTSAPFIVQADNSGAPDVIGDASMFRGPFTNFGPIITTFELAAALAPSTTTHLFATPGNVLLGGGRDEPAAGGVLGYNAGFPFGNITGELSDYATGPASGGELPLFGISRFVGDVTTDALGNIAAWDLVLTNYRVGGGFSSVWVGPGAEPAGYPALDVTNVGEQFIIGSGPASLGPSGVNVRDVAFFDPGPVQINLSTGAPGSFASVNAIPEPGTLALLGLALAFLPWVGRRPN